MVGRFCQNLQAADRDLVIAPDALDPGSRGFDRNAVIGFDLRDRAGDPGLQMERLVADL
jgi:hypothetical protein